MGDAWACWRCGADLADFPRPYGRYAQCPACRADLHVCLMCKHHDPRKAKQCRELAADGVKDVTRANACEWFQPTPGTHLTAVGKPAHPTPSELDALFADPASATPHSADPACRRLDDLFGGKR